jgi:hypothetical protein
MGREMARSARFAGVLALCALAACTRAQPPVHFFAEGRPEHLRDWHVVFRDGGLLALNGRVVPYDLNTPLFSDYAHKLRTVWMPAASAAKYSATESFDFPVGTIFSKTFYFPRAAGAAVSRTSDQSRDFLGLGLNLANVRLIETRLLVRREHGWEALPYEIGRASCRERV